MVGGDGCEGEGVGRSRRSIVEVVEVLRGR